VNLVGIYMLEYVVECPVKRKIQAQVLKSPEWKIYKCGKARYKMKEFKKALNYGYLHKNNKEFPESTTENFTSTICNDELRNYLIHTNKNCTTYKYRLKNIS
jgi:hypothetical protein